MCCFCCSGGVTLLPHVQAPGGAAGSAGSVSPHQQLLHPEQGPLCAGTHLVLWDCKILVEPRNRARPLCTPCAAHPPFPTQGLMPGTRLLFYLFCGGVGFSFLFKSIFQTNKLITPTSCRDASNCIRGSLLPNRCCQGSAELPAVLVTACSDSGADKGSLCPRCCSRASSSSQKGPWEHPGSGHLQSPSPGVKQRLCRSALGGYPVLYR